MLYGPDGRLKYKGPITSWYALNARKALEDEQRAAGRDVEGEKKCLIWEKDE